MVFVQTATALTYSGGGEWNYSEELLIQENSGTSLVNYQIPVILDSSNFDFSVARSEGEDIRFTSGDKQLQHWIEQWDAKKESAVIWVEVPSVAANGNTKITMYYGNPSASDISSGPTTFDFFDDFTSTGLFSKWETFTTGGGELEVSAGVCNIIVPKFHPEDVATIKSKDEFSINSMFVAKRKKTTTGTDTRGPVIIQGFVDPQKETKNQILTSSELENETKVTWILENSKSGVRYFPKDLTNINEVEGDWYTIGVAWYMGEEFGNIAWFKDGVRDSKMNLESTEENNYVPVNDMKVYLYTGTYSDVSDNTGYSSIDYAYVRKYVSEEPTVTFTGSMTEEIITTPEPVKINITPASGLMTAIRIFDTTGYDDAAILDLKDSGLNTIMLLTDGENIWNLEKFVKTAHDNDMQVYAMILNDPKSDSDEDNSAYVTGVLEKVIDYNSKSLSAFDGVDIALDPCSENLGEACTLNLLLLEEVRDMTGNELAIAVDIPSSYTLSDISNVSEDADLIILQTYALDGSNPETKNDVIDAVASRMGEIRASESKALIGIAVNTDFITDTAVQSLLEEVQTYYVEDTAFMGTSIVVYEDYEAYTTVPETVEPEETESKGIPGFTVLFAVAGLVAVAYRQKRR
jgi:PGF-CTERM protein